MNNSRIPAAIFLACWMLTGAALSWWVSALWFRSEEQPPDLSIQITRALTAMLIGAVIGVGIHALLPHRPRTMREVARMFQFSLRELVLLTALVATLLGWWLDKSVVRTRYQTEAKRNRTIASHLSLMARDVDEMHRLLSEIGYRAERIEQRKLVLVKLDPPAATLPQPP